METIVEKQKMESLKALADTNMSISEAKGILFKLQETETEYLVEREKKAVARIQKSLEESDSLIKETYANYEEIKNLSNTVSLFSNFLSESYTKFQEMVSFFSEQSNLWEKDMQRQERQISEIKEKMKAERIIIQNDKESIERRQKQLKDDQRRIEDQRQTLARSIERLKQNRI